MPANLASSVLTSFFGKPAATFINDKTNQIIWKKVQIISVDIDGESANTIYPASELVITEDSVYRELVNINVQPIKILRPSRVRLTMMCPNLSSIEEVVNSFADTTLTLMISTKSLTILSMCITEVTVEQVPEKLSATLVQVTMEQSEALQTIVYSPSQSGDFSVMGIKIQIPPVVSQTVQGLYSKVTSLF